MARIYLDANYFIGLIENRKLLDNEKIRENKLFLSPLSIHIYLYLYKKRVPDQKLIKFQESINIVPVDKLITSKSIAGPTSDFEDNLQLHSSASGDCDYFLTNDKSLLNLRFFGKTKVTNFIPNQ